MGRAYMLRRVWERGGKNLLTCSGGYGRSLPYPASNSLPKLARGGELVAVLVAVLVASSNTLDAMRWRLRSLWREENLGIGQIGL